MHYMTRLLGSALLSLLMLSAAQAAPAPDQLRIGYQKGSVSMVLAKVYKGKYVNVRGAKLLFPHLDLKIPEVPQPGRVSAHGEAVANDFVPRRTAAS